jgi:hypothetical protein
MLMLNDNLLYYSVLGNNIFPLRRFRMREKRVHYLIWHSNRACRKKICRVENKLNFSKRISNKVNKVTQYEMIGAK